jgi:hypothetical protein
MLKELDEYPTAAVKLVKAMFGFMEMYPKLSGVVVMIPAIIKHLPRELANKMFDRFFDYEGGAWNNPEVARELAEEDSSTEVSPDKLFASLIAGNIREVRRALSKPVPEMKGQTPYEWFTGMKEPWKPDIKDTGSVEESYHQLLPIMDIALVHVMDYGELEKHIEGRLAKLKLLPGKQKLDQHVFLWREKQKEMIDAGRIGVPDSDNIPTTLVKMMLVLERAETVAGDKESLPLTKKFTEFLARTKFESKEMMVRQAYALLVNHRMEITQATREIISPTVAINGEIVNGKKNGGEGSGGEGAPPASSSGGAAPTESTPTSNSQDFMGIVSSSAAIVYDSGPAEPLIADANDLYAESGIEFMAGSTMNAAVFGATAAQASMGMTL